MSRSNMETLLTFADGARLVISTQCSKQCEFSCALQCGCPAWHNGTSYGLNDLESLMNVALGSNRVGGRFKCLRKSTRSIQTESNKPQVKIARTAAVFEDLIYVLRLHKRAPGEERQC